jgi:hypothetical protein
MAFVLLLSQFRIHVEDRGNFYLEFVSSVTGQVLDEITIKNPRYLPPPSPDPTTPPIEDTPVNTTSLKPVQQVPVTWVIVVTVIGSLYIVGYVVLLHN